MTSQDWAKPKLMPFVAILKLKNSLHQVKCTLSFTHVQFWLMPWGLLPFLCLGMIDIAAKEVCISEYTKCTFLCEFLKHKKTPANLICGRVWLYKGRAPVHVGGV